MMDIATRFDSEHLRGDVEFDGLALAVDDTVLTAILHCLFTDRRAPEGYPLPDGSEDRRGWWGDCLALDPDDEGYGSLLWLLAREKQTEATRRRAEDFCRQALQILVDKGILRRFEVQVSFPRDGRMEILVDAESADGVRHRHALGYPMESNA